MPGQLVRALSPESGRRHDKPKIRGGATRAPVNKPGTHAKASQRGRDEGDTPDRGCRGLRKVTLVGM
ncbi:hypothetical protein HNR22_003208 [Micromonospora jinlongensis]|uniref:Uncharacterized protein n=1 Tax=Micromonospora jinlongensis TaxID=1287877 RepID=A0A7Z0BE13_9ACTN|nr:hypothetical protein [Micromonospora jinlongensis]TQJ25196.1 hypothetical protein FBZ33_5542 [Micromonospora sp. A202]SCG64670.1 hypothetical protein GA0070619_5016 [Micromonospora zamorensis]